MEVTREQVFNRLLFELNNGHRIIYAKRMAKQLDADDDDDVKRIFCRLAEDQMLLLLKDDAYRITVDIYELRKYVLRETEERDDEENNLITEDVSVTLEELSEGTWSIYHEPPPPPRRSPFDYSFRNILNSDDDDDDDDDNADEDDEDCDDIQSEEEDKSDMSSEAGVVEKKTDNEDEEDSIAKQERIMTLRDRFRQLAEMRNAASEVKPIDNASIMQERYDRLVRMICDMPDYDPETKVFSTWLDAVFPDGKTRMKFRLVRESEFGLFLTDNGILSAFLHSYIGADASAEKKVFVKYLLTEATRGTKFCPREDTIYSRISGCTTEKEFWGELMNFWQHYSMFLGKIRWLIGSDIGNSAATISEEKIDDFVDGILTLSYDGKRDDLMQMLYRRIFSLDPWLDLEQAIEIANLIWEKLKAKNFFSDCCVAMSGVIHRLRMLDQREFCRLKFSVFTDNK